jgi:hypothetical protein
MPTEINWGSIADWVSGIGSLSAVIVALYLSKASMRVRLYGICGHRIVFEHGKDVQQHLISVFITNIGPRSTVVNNIGLRFGLFKKKYGIIKILEGEFTQPIPKTLVDGEQGHWGFELNDQKSWITDLFRNEFITSWLDVQTMHIEVYTTNGGSFRFRPEPSLRKLILELYKENLKSKTN